MSDSFSVLNPSSGESLVELPKGGGPQCVAALERASAAFTSWASRTPHQRATILRKAAEIIRSEVETLAPLTVQESGKPFVEAKGEWLVAADLIDFFAEQSKRVIGEIIPSPVPGRKTEVTYQPLGVVGIITAWNFPVYNPARSWAAALAAGCAVVAKPAELTPLSAFALGDAFACAGLPEGVLSIVCGDAPAIGKELLDSPVCRKVSFTGSVRVGKELMALAAKNVTRLGLELGGNAPALIFPDVNVGEVARSAVQAKFRNNGQVCVAPQRFLVHASIAEEFISAAREEASKLVLGSGLDSKTTVGPLISARQREHIERLVADAKERGASIECGGRRPPSLPNGFFYEPTVLSGVTADMAIFREEAFGPVMPILTFTETRTALELANQTEYGLAAYVWTNDIKVAHAMSTGLECGLVAVNAWAAHATEVPFSGWKQSGIGTECGAAGLLEYYERKVVAFGGMMRL